VKRSIIARAILATFRAAVEVQKALAGAISARWLARGVVSRLTPHRPGPAPGQSAVGGYADEAASSAGAAAVPWPLIAA